MRIGRCVDCGAEFTTRAHNTIRCRGTDCERRRNRQWRMSRRRMDVPADNERVRQWRKTARILVILTSAKSRAKRLGIEFRLSPGDIEIPAACPILGIPLACGNGVTTPGSPSLDRINPLLGYVPGNVAVISHRANRIKNDATLAELLLVAEYVRRHSGRAAHVA